MEKHEELKEQEVRLDVNLGEVEHNKQYSQIKDEASAKEELRRWRNGLYEEED